MGRAPVGDGLQRLVDVFQDGVTFPPRVRLGTRAVASQQFAQLDRKCVFEHAIAVAVYQNLIVQQAEFSRRLQNAGSQGYVTMQPNRPPRRVVAFPGAGQFGSGSDRHTSIGGRVYDGAGQHDLTARAIVDHHTADPRAAHHSTAANGVEIRLDAALGRDRFVQGSFQPQGVEPFAVQDAFAPPLKERINQDKARSRSIGRTTRQCWCRQFVTKVVSGLDEDHGKTSVRGRQRSHRAGDSSTNHDDIRLIDDRDVAGCLRDSLPQGSSVDVRHDPQVAGGQLCRGCFYWFGGHHKRRSGRHKQDCPCTANDRSSRTVRDFCVRCARAFRLWQTNRPRRVTQHAAIPLGKDRLIRRIPLRWESRSNS